MGLRRPERLCPRPQQVLEAYGFSKDTSGSVTLVSKRPRNPLPGQGSRRHLGSRRHSEWWHCFPRFHSAAVA
eukprot:416316-Rhodomonas_salina.7